MPNLLREAQRSLDRTVAASGDLFPHVTRDGRWELLPAEAGPEWHGPRWTHGNWTAGFWVGCLWLAFLWTGENRYAAAARRWANRLAGRERDDRTHDLGFLFYPSHALGYVLTGDGALRDRALAAADTLAARFVPTGGYIQAWGPRGHPDWVGTSTIDTMMNLPLLWWAARLTGKESYRAVATRHALTTRRSFFRPDGSTYHRVLYDSGTGRVLQTGTFQGFSDESCWSRGQAWALRGYAVAYRETQDERFLRAAEDAAGYFLRRLPDDLVPYWDFDDPAIPEAPRDSSAAAIAADGLLDLSSTHPRPEQRDSYRMWAHRLLGALAASCHNRDPDRIDGILLHGCYSRPAGEGIDEALIWGDYFYLHALLWAHRGASPDSPGEIRAPAYPPPDP
jgi:unsaturated chondroitin disaccharide hydrolase